MKNYIIKLSLVLSVVLLFAACEQERIMFDTSLAVVGFQSDAFDIPEAEGDSIILYLGATSGTAPTEVTLEVSTEGHANPAIEGEDYTIESKQVTLEVGVTKVAIIPVDNDIFTGDKTFTVTIVSNSKDYEQAVQRSAVVTIKDDEHPLNQWIGTYDVFAASYGSPGAWDENWVVTTSPVAGNPDQLQLLGVGGGDQPIIATFDPEEMTITIAPGQNAGNAYGYGPTIVYWGETDLSGFDEEEPLVGDIEADGSMSVDRWTMVLQDYGNYIWDCFNTTWTKR
ncbi:MAG TPA: hypothetical protein ENN63_03550 [Bacteroidetes bacterium]|nr:hypothetical protein [Bacteroidota bacterium]